MRAGGAGISSISGAWAAVPSVGPMCMTNGIEKASGRVGAGGAWRRRRRTGGDESGECWNFGYQRCMGGGSFGRADLCGQWS
jgi:hypothetical protein